MTRKANNLFDSFAANCHPFYRKVHEFRNGPLDIVRDHINMIWQWYSKAHLEDDNFVSDFPIQTTKRWWELETAWFLHNCGFELTKRKAGSDFLCERAGIVIEVEAIVIGPGTGGNPDVVTEIELKGNGRVQTSEPFFIDERERIELLRVTNAIDVKAKKHRCDIQKGKSGSLVPFVIALSTVDMPVPLMAGWNMPPVLKAVYPIGGLYYDVDPESGKLLRKRLHYRSQVNKETSAHTPISTRIFYPGCGSEYSRAVSAILYGDMQISCNDSGIEIANRGYPYSPDEQFMRFAVIHNEDCMLRLGKGSIAAGIEYWLEPLGNGEYELVRSSIDK